MSAQNKPHTHRDLIKAWADGCEIQMLSTPIGAWVDCPSPLWYSDQVYRIKPKEPVVRWNWVYRTTSGTFLVSTVKYTEKEAIRQFGGVIQPVDSTKQIYEE